MGNVSSTGDLKVIEIVHRRTKLPSQKNRISFSQKNTCENEQFSQKRLVFKLFPQIPRRPRGHVGLRAQIVFLAFPLYFSGQSIAGQSCVYTPVPFLEGDWPMLAEPLAEPLATKKCRSRCRLEGVGGVVTADAVAVCKITQRHQC